MNPLIPLQWFDIKKCLPPAHVEVLIRKGNQTCVASYCDDCFYDDNEMPVYPTHWQPLDKE